MPLPRRPGKLPLPARWIAGLFGLKLIWALGYTYYFFQVSPHSSDVWGYFAQSRQEARLIHSPADFFQYAFPTLDHPGDLLHYAFWNNLKENIYLLLLLGMNLVTFHNPFADTLLFCLLTFTGWIRFIRLLQALYPGLAPGWYCVPFCLPVFLFCYSGLHSDGLIFALLGWIAWDGYRLLPGSGVSTRRTATTLRFGICCILLACLKAYLFIFLVTLCAAWWGAGIYPAKKVYAWVFLLASGAAILLFSVPEQAARQHEYLQANFLAAVTLSPMSPTVKDYFLGFPHALITGWLRPFPWETGSLRYIYAGLELLGVWALCLWGMRLRRSFFEASWMYLAGVICLLAGYTIPVAGALLRYRALFFPFVIAFSLFPILQRRSRKA